MLDKLYQHFVPIRKSKVTDVAMDAASTLLAWMLPWLWQRRQSLTPQRVYVRIQNGRGYQEKSSRYRGNSRL